MKSKIDSWGRRVFMFKKPCYRTGLSGISGIIFDKKAEYSWKRKMYISYQPGAAAYYDTTKPGTWTGD